MKFIDKENSRLLQQIHAKDTYKRAFKRSLIIGLVAGVAISLIYILPFDNKTDKVIQSGTSLGLIYGLAMTTFISVTNFLQIYMAKRGLSNGDSTKKLK